MGVSMGEMLLDVIEAGGVEQDQYAAAEATAHHAGPDDLGHPGGQLHETVKLPAAYREIELKALMRCVEDWAQATGRPPAQRVGCLQHAGVLGNDVASAAPLDRIVDALQIGLRGIAKTEMEGRRCGLAFFAPLVVCG
jgi:hypothetical protein